MAEESLFFNSKNRISNPYSDRYYRASIDTLHDDYFSISSVNRGNFKTIDRRNIWQTIKKYPLAFAAGKINTFVQDYLESMPFILHSSDGLNFASDGETNISADVLFKALDLGSDDSGDPLGLALCIQNIRLILIVDLLSTLGSG